jgi:hypothetical protein
MPGQRFGVGIVGVEPGRSWAARGHIPALRALSGTFEIIGVAKPAKPAPNGPLPRLDCRGPSPTSPSWLLRQRSTSSLSR